MNSIITTVDSSQKNYLPIFLASLRTLGQFTGTVYVVSYARPIETRNTIVKYNGTQRFTKLKMVSSVHRYKELLRYVRSLNPTDKVAYFDVMTWFQQPVSPLFDINITGVLHAPGIKNERIRYFGNSDYTDQQKFVNLQNQLETTYSGIVSDGLLVGTVTPMLVKLRGFASTLANAVQSPVLQGSERFILNRIFNSNIDKITEGHLYSVRPDEAIMEGGVVYSMKNGKQQAIGIRVSDQQSSAAFQCQVLHNNILA